MRYLAIAALLALAAGASADLLWDNGPFDLGSAAGNGKGTATAFGQVDLQIAEDFEVPAPGWLVYDIHFEGLCFYGGLNVDYVTVEFFKPNGDLPMEDPFYSMDSYDFTESDYYDPNWGYYHVDIDANFGPVALDPGVYWVKMQPYGLVGDWFYQGGTESGGWGYTCANRNGPWGGGYPSDTWTHYSGYDLNYKLTGEIIPEPGVVSLAGLLLGAGALWLRRK